ncbi:MAG TPA: ECF transporter S component [Clostridiaceae bacterium]
MTTKKLVTLSLFAALCFVSTLYLKIPLPFLGPNSMMHLGTTVIFVSAVLIGPAAGYSSAIGMTLSDIFAYPTYAIPTFIIKGLHGYATGKIAYLNNKQGTSTLQNLIGFIVGSLISLVGYFITDAIFYKNVYTALTSAIGSLLTSGIGIILALIIVSALKPVLKRSQTFSNGR